LQVAPCLFQMRKRRRASEGKGPSTLAGGPTPMCSHPDTTGLERSPTISRRSMTDKLLFGHLSIYHQSHEIHIYRCITVNINKINVYSQAKVVSLCLLYNTICRIIDMPNHTSAFRENVRLTCHADNIYMDSNND